MATQRGQRGKLEAAAEKRLRAFELRKQGHAYRSIGREIGVSVAMAFRYVNETLEELKSTALVEAEHLRNMELERLDGMLAGLWPAASSGDPQSVAAALRIGERRAKLLGLDAPTKLAGHDGGALTFVELARQAMAEAPTVSTTS